MHDNFLSFFLSLVLAFQLPSMRTVALATLVMEMKVLSQTAQQVPSPVSRMMPTMLLLLSVVFEDILTGLVHAV